MPQRLLCVLLLVFGALITMPSMAFADLISPGQESCSNKKLGDACSINGEDGACVEGQRCRPTPDGSEDCSTILTCDPDAEPNTEEPANNTTTSEEPADTSSSDTTAGSETGSEDAPKQRGCAQASSAGIPFGAFLLGFLLLGLTRRRRED
jgi:hypothetical protein